MPLMCCRRTNRKGKQQKESTQNADSPGSSLSPNASGGNRLRRTSSLPSVPVKYYNYDAKMTKFQKRSLRFTWHRLQTRNGGKRVDSVFEEVFERVLKLRPQAKDMFTTRAFLSAISRSGMATIRDHARATVRMVDMAIRQLDKEEDKKEWVEKHDPKHIGRQHNCLRVYGFRSDFWEAFGEVMVDVVLAQEAVRDLPGAGQAWVVLTACLIDQLRAGFEEGRASNMPTASPRPTRGPTSVLQNAARHLEDTDLPDPTTAASSLNIPQPRGSLSSARSLEESTGCPASPTSPPIAGCSKSSSQANDNNQRPKRSDSVGSPQTANSEESPSSSGCPFPFVNAKKSDGSTPRPSNDSTTTRNSVNDGTAITTEDISKRLVITSRDPEMDSARESRQTSTTGGWSPRSSVSSVGEVIGLSSRHSSSSGGRTNSTTFSSGYPINGRQPSVCQEFAKDRRPTSNCVLRPISELEKNSFTK
uniref:Globin family profile domain-containing protein n=1 Tax=Plectus sambesii TaxID=2011161 RepID=A0A914V381_9BILA